MATHRVDPTGGARYLINEGAIKVEQATTLCGNQVQRVGHPGEAGGWHDVELVGSVVVAIHRRRPLKHAEPIDIVYGNVPPSCGACRLEIRDVAKQLSRITGLPEFLILGDYLETPPR